MNHELTNRREELVLSKDTFEKLLALVKDPQLVNHRLRRAIDELLMGLESRREETENCAVNCP